MDRAHTESSSVSMPATSSGDDEDDEDAVSEFNRDLQAIKDAEARHVAAKAAKKNEKQKPKSRRVPVRSQWRARRICSRWPQRLELMLTSRNY